MFRLRSTAARLELKGIGGGLHKRWSMLFNLIVHVKPYQTLDWWIEMSSRLELR